MGKNKIFIILAIFALGFGGYYFYQTKHSDKVQLEYCADLNLVAKQIVGEIPRDYLDYNESLRYKLKHPKYEKVWDDCAYELKNSSIKFHAKYKR